MCSDSAERPGAPATLVAPVPRVGGLSLGAFLRDYAATNMPVVTGGASAGWRAALEWVTACGAPDVAALGVECGAHVAPVVTCGGGGGGGYGGEARRDMSVAEFATLWAAGSADALYLKDWHYFRDCSDVAGGARGAAYEVPVACCDDWLNWYWDRRGGSLALEVSRATTPPGAAPDADSGGRGVARRDDFRFVYVGGAHTSTPLHVDVLHSHSWSVNVAGRKRWVLFSPVESAKLYDVRNGGCLADVGADACVDAVAFPRYASAARLEVVQEAGEARAAGAGRWRRG